MRNLPLLLILLLSTCAPAPNCQAQVPDTLITVTKLPYPEARFFPYERSELPRLPSPARDERFGEGHERSEHATAAAQNTNLPTRRSRPTSAVSTKQRQPNLPTYQP